MVAYIPKKGNIIWLDFTSQSGYEQAGKRPAMVLSPYKFNNKITGFILCCSITSKIKRYPFEVKIEGKIKGVVLSEQVRVVLIMGHERLLLLKLHQMGSSMMLLQILKRF